jgi:hypothetical protein
MARKMRSGTLVGPGTNKKLRPGFLAPAIDSSPDNLAGVEPDWASLAERVLASAIAPCNLFQQLE